MTIGRQSVLQTYGEGFVLDDILEREFVGDSSLVFLCPINISLALALVHRPSCLGYVIRSSIEEYRHIDSVTCRKQLRSMSRRNGKKASNKANEHARRNTWGKSL